jgi:hypothetical protein
MHNRTVHHILTTIENLEKELAFLKTLVQQAISEEDSEDHQGDIIVDAAFLDPDDDEILADATVIQDSKPTARNLTLKEQRREGRRRAKEWAEAEKLAKSKR